MRVFRSHLLTGVGAIVVAATMNAANAPANAADGTAYFERIASMPVYETLDEGVDKKTETVAEIAAASKDGRTLIFTDSPGEALVFADATQPAAPKPLGRTALGGEPTSVAVAGGFALAGVNTSESFVKPGGHLAVIGIDSRETVAKCDVKGQPDSVATSPDGKFVAIAIENERDEELNDGVIPQMPAGHLAIFDLDAEGPPDQLRRRAHRRHDRPCRGRAERSGAGIRFHQRRRHRRRHPAGKQPHRVGRPRHGRDHGPLFRRHVERREHPDQESPRRRRHRRDRGRPPRARCGRLDRQ